MKHNPLFFLLLIILLIFLFMMDLTTGSVDISLTDLWTLCFNNDLPEAKILFKFRLPKALAAIYTGIALSVAGLQMQTVFRNPLADPYVLGVSSGAGLGVALFTMSISSLAIIDPLRNLGTYFAAFAGAALVLALVMTVSLRVRDLMSVLILGVMFGSGISAIISILQYFGTSAEVKTYVLWTMGSLASVSSDKLWLMTGALTVGLALAVYSIKPLNAILLGETCAKSMGVNLVRSRNIIFLSTGLLTGTATAFCGPIGFIGIAVPHLARMLFQQANHRILIPATMLTGACIMLLCDIISQSIVKDLTLPINSITALLGIPVIIFVIAAYNRKQLF
ncbi:MAG: iron ABC transporter permease [Prevotellaceae bacterium]|jgi:iron complex transport system permease protein|nr:iron ABC transporter permease [Prevotellaceae bacterium]